MQRSNLLLHNMGCFRSQMNQIIFYGIPCPFYYSDFTSQLNLVVASRVHSSLHPNYLHQMAYAKFNLKVHFPLPYEPKIRTKNMA